MAGLNGVTTIPLILIVSFAIDRVVASVLFVLTAFGLLADPADVTDAKARVAERSYKLIYFTFAGLLAAAVMALDPGIRLLTAMGIDKSPALDFLVTLIVLTGGADRIAALLKAPGSSGGAGEAAPRPIQITGKLTLDEPAGKSPAAGPK